MEPASPPGDAGTWRDLERVRLRPLTESEHAVLREALAPVLRDIEASGAIQPAIEDEAHDDPDGETVRVWVRSADGTRTGIFVPPEPLAAERVAWLADHVQEWELEELAAQGRPATWPECPDHPRSHPLEPVPDDERAAWRCPRSGRVVCAIGTLGRIPGPPGPDAAGR